MVENSPSETTDESREVTVTVYIVPDIVTVTNLTARGTLSPPTPSPPPTLRPPTSSPPPPTPPLRQSYSKYFLAVTRCYPGPLVLQCHTCQLLIDILSYFYLYQPRVESSVAESVLDDLSYNWQTSTHLPQPGGGMR